MGLCASPRRCWPNNSTAQTHCLHCAVRKASILLRASPRLWASASLITSPSAPKIAFHSKTPFYSKRGSGASHAIVTTQCPAGHAAALRMDRALPLYAILSALLLQLLEPERIPADPPPPHTGKLRPSLYEPALPHGNSALAAHRVFGRGAVAADRLPAGLLPRLSLRTPPPSALPGGHHPAVGQLPCACIRM